MNKTVTLYPKYISTGASLDGVIGNGTRAGGEDYRTIPASSMLYVGTIAFNTNPLLNLSTACILKNYDITFNQRCGIWTGGTELYWEFIPRRLTNVEYGDTLSNGGVYLNKFTAYGMSQSSAISKTNGGDYLDGGRSRTLYSGSYEYLIGYSGNLLGFYLQANNPAAFKYKLYLKDLYATVTYEAKYRVVFYDDDGSPLSSQTVNGGERATAPNVSRTGYTVAWSCDGKSGTYSASNLPTSEDTDLVFRAVYNPIPKVLGVTVPPKGQLNVYKAVNNAWQMQEGSLENGKHYYTFYYGDHIKVEAVGCNDLSEDLIAELSDPFDGPISSTTVNGASSTTLKVFESNSYTANRILTVTPQPHYFTITTVAGAGGTITTTHRVTRTAPTTIYVRTISGYRIKTVKVDGVSQSIPDDQLYSKTFVNVQADHSVEATFERIQYSITFDLPQGVSVTANGTAVSGNSLTVDHGDEIEFVFSCGDNLSLTGLFLDDSEDSLMDPVFKQVKTAAHTIYYVDGAHTLKATATSDLVTIGITQPNQAYGTITGETGKYIRQASGSTNTLTFTVTENVGYGFVKWDDDSTTRPLVFAPTADRTVSATFEALDQVTRAFVNAQKPYYKNATAQDKLIVPFIGGKISAKGQTSKDVTISAKTSDTTAFSFVADPGFVFESAFVRYYDSADPDLSHPDRTETTTSNPFSLHDLSAKRVQIEAYFKRLTYEVDVTPKEEAKTPDGTCTVSVLPQAYTDETYTDPKQYFFESVLTLTATPGEGWYFSKWSDEGGEGKNVRTITIPVGGVELQAIFRKYTFEQHFTSCEGGSISIDGQSATDVTAEYGDNLLLTFTAEIGQKIKDVLLDGVSVFEDVTLTRRGGTYWLRNITAAHTVAVVFTPRIYTNGRKLLDYYPPVIRSIVDIQRLMAAFQIENDAMWDAISFVAENQYIETATAEGVSMWERELGIIPAATDTLNQRKARLRLKWVPSNNFTTKWLHGWLKDACGTDVPWPEVEGYTLKVTLPWFATWWSIFEDLRLYKPANIVLDPNVALPEDSGNLYAGFAMQTEYEYEVDGEAAEPLYDDNESEESP